VKFSTRKTGGTVVDLSGTRSITLSASNKKTREAGICFQGFRMIWAFPTRLRRNLRTAPALRSCAWPPFSL